MSMDGPSPAARIARAAAAIIVSGLVAGICFLIVIQEAERRGHTDLDFNHTLGTIVEGQEAEDLSTRAALGVIGDSAGPTGLIWTLLLAIVVMLGYALVIVPLVRRGWIVRGLVLAAATLLALGLVFPLLASQYLEDDLGPFGTGYGTATVISFILSSLVFGMLGARCHDLVASARWWTPRGESLDESLEELDIGPPQPPSLELSE